MEELKCLSCGIGVLPGEGVIFKCPNCGEKIIRCKGCRELASCYTCHKCSFTGP